MNILKNSASAVTFGAILLIGAFVSAGQSSVRELTQDEKLKSTGGFCHRCITLTCCAVENCRLIPCTAPAGTACSDRFTIQAFPKSCEGAAAGPLCTQGQVFTCGSRWSCACHNGFCKDVGNVAACTGGFRGC